MGFIPASVRHFLWQQEGGLPGLRATTDECFDLNGVVAGPLVRGLLAAASEERLVMGAAGYLTSWAAMHPEWRGMHGALEQVGPILARYLEGRGRSWEADVVRKRMQRMEVTGWADDPAEDVEDVA